MHLSVKKFMFLLLPVLLFGIITLSNQQVFGEGATDPAPTIDARGSVNGLQVLFDNTHGQTAGAADWVIDGGFSDFANAIADNGYAVKELRKQGAITYDDLKDYDVFVMPEANIPYKSTEQDAIIQYIQNGGSVFFISDHYNADRNLNRWDSSEAFNGYRRGAWNDPTKGMSTEEANSDRMTGVQSSDWLANNFGVRFRYNALGTVTADNIVAPSQSFGITEGVSTVAMHAGSTLAILDPNKAKGIVYLPQTDAAWSYAVDQGVYNGGGVEEGPYVAISKLGAGKAAFIGDSSPVEDSTPKYKREMDGTTKTTYDGFQEQDDATLLTNLIDWLAAQESYTSFDQVSGLELSPETQLLSMENPQNSTEPESEPWSQPDAGYDWWDPTTFASGSYGPIDGSGGDTGGDGTGAGVFISEYVEGSSYNKALEIYNGTGSSIDLSNYSVELSNTSSDIALSGTLAAGDVFVVANPNASTSILSETDLQDSGVAFNGDDQVTLKENGTAIDVVGVSGSTWGEDTTLVRNDTVSEGVTSYDSSQWDSYAGDTFSYLGTHSAPISGGGSSSELFFSEYIEGSSYNKALEIYNGTGSSIDLSSYTIDLSNTGSSITLSGTLASGDVFVIANPNASTSILSETDQQDSGIAFNGDDSVTLLKNGTAIDVIGTAGSVFAEDTTLVRENTITDGTTTYESSEWTTYSQDTFSYLGSR
ncbi:lamin tail domain-containing protein [Pontibacillus marinus]|uniref:DNA-binding protein n=1 Tax=Pontibacillus marinus BH030004 = DSM 16465 TaxID=1385511 RepID=A0A0A5GKQ2_9BACI|nr:DNA-binding protein [Pontibacillus marinus BH030004 = DSM 16465]